MHQSRIGLLLPWGTMRYMDMNTYTTLLYMVIYIQHICGGLGVVISQLNKALFIGGGSFGGGS